MPVEKNREYYERRNDIIDQTKRNLENNADVVDFVFASVIEKQATKLAIKKVTSKEGYVPPAYPDYDLACFMYVSVLEYRRLQDEDTFTGVIEDILTGVTDDKKKRWEDTRLSSYHKELAKKVRDRYMEHPEYLTLKENTTVDHYKLAKPYSLNSQIHTLYKYKKDSDKMRNFKERLDYVEDIVKKDTLKISMLETSVNHLLGIMKMNLEDFHRNIAGDMKKQGFSQRQVADSLGKSISTIKRWWKEI